MADPRSRRLPAGVSDIPAAELDALDPTLPRVAVALATPGGPGGRFSASRRPSRRTLLRHVPFALVFVLAIFLLTLNVATPWHGSHEDNGLVFESAAINDIRFGLGFTRGQDFFDNSVNPPTYTPSSVHPRGVSDAQEFQYLLTGPAQPDIYAHHPPLLALTIAGSLLTFGYHFWAVRLVPITFTLIALLLFYRLMTLLFDRRAATFAALLFITFPIAAYYGRDVAHEAPTMCCELGMTLCYLLWRRSGRAGWLVGVAGCVALGMWYGWPMFFFAWILLALDTLAARRLRWRLALATGATVTLMFSLVIVQIAWVSGWSLARLQSIFFVRSDSFGADPTSFQPYQWVMRVLHFNVLDFGPWTWVALPLALLFLWSRLRQEGLTLRIQLIGLYGLGGLAHLLVFREGAYVHDYWQFYLIPFYAALLGWGGVALAQRLASHPQAQRLPARLSGVSARMLASAEARQTALLWAFAALALVMGAPLIYHLYAGGSLAHLYPGTEPVTPLLTAPAQLVKVVAGYAR